MEEFSLGGRHMLLLRTPRTPQAFASRTVVLIQAGRIAVVTGSDVEQRQRLQAFETLVEGLELGAKP
jgi:hypothetical protein